MFLRAPNGFRILLISLFSLAAVGAAWGQADSGQIRMTSPAQATLISKIHVDIEDDIDNRGYWIGLAKNVIFLREGESFSPAKLQASIEALKLCRQFKEIHVDSEGDDNTIDLYFRLKLNAYIKDIRIKSVYPFFKREILNAMTITPGDVYSPGMLTNQLDLLTQFIGKRGFFAPGIYISAQEDVKDGHYVVYVELVKGPYYALDHIEIKGNRHFSEPRLKMKFGSWRESVLPGFSSRLVEKEIKKETAALSRFYWRKGFPDAKIAVVVEKDIEKEAFSVLITIEEGPEYKVEFTGNNAFWDFTLAKDLVLFSHGNKNNIGVRKSLRNILSRYRKAGFLEARVRVKEIPEKEGEAPLKQLQFVISEGPQSIVESITISGNHSISTRQIKKQMLTDVPGLLHKGSYVPEVLEEDVGAIYTIYAKQGFQNAQIEEKVQLSEDGKRVNIHIDINEARQMMVSHVRIKNLTAITKEEAYQEIRLKEGEPYHPYLVRADENRLSALIAEKGYPHVTVKGVVLEDAHETETRIEYRVDEGIRVKMGEIYCSGNFRTKEQIIRNEIDISPGQPYSLKKMLDSRRNIQSMDIFQSTHFKSIGLKEEQETVNLFVEVQEKDPYYFELGGGFQSDIGFFAEAKGGDYNLFGTNKDAYVRFKYSEIGHRSDFAIKEPRFLGARVVAKFDLFREVEEDFNKAFGTDAYGGSIGFYKKWFKTITTGITGQYELKDTYSIETRSLHAARASFPDFPYPIEIEETGVRSIITLTPSVGYDTRDSFVRPRKGISATLAVDFSDGVDRTNDNEDSLDDFIRYRFDLKYYYTPVQFLTIAWHGRAGHIVPQNTMEWVLSDHLFFLGGTSDVRGFRENMLIYYDDTALGGLSEVLGSMEVRTEIGFNFELSVFLDTGRIYQTGYRFKDPELDKFRSSIGLGLRYFTPIGPMGILYGWKLNPTPYEKEHNDFGRLHLSIGYTF